MGRTITVSHDVEWQFVPDDAGAFSYVDRNGDQVRARRGRSDRPGGTTLYVIPEGATAALLALTARTILERHSPEPAGVVCAADPSLALRMTVLLGLEVTE